MSFVLQQPLEATRSELSEVLGNLQAHWNVLEAEVLEINKDISSCEVYLKKYGEQFRAPLTYLKDLKHTKKETMKEIIVNMECFNSNLQGSRQLVKSLNKQTFVKPATNSNTNLSNAHISTMQPSSTILSFATHEKEARTTPFKK